LAGRDSALHLRHRLFVEIVPNGLPFLPQLPQWHLIESFDVCVAKLIRFSADDITDIDSMIQLGRLAHGHFIERFKNAFDVETREDKLRSLVENLHRVESDMFDAEPTTIELPSWC
jgi:hypothetical protein